MTRLAVSMVVCCAVPVLAQVPPGLRQTAVQQPGIISVRQLARKIRPEAKREFTLSEKAARKGDSQAATAHLRIAVSLDENFVEAYNNLGLALVAAGQTAEGLWMLERAAQLDPGSVEPQINVAAALGVAGDNSGAERAARNALRLDPGNSRARVVLGMVLVAQKKAFDEALFHFRRAADAYPRAHLLAANALEEAGRIEEAKRERAAYDSAAPSETARR